MCGSHRRALPQGGEFGSKAVELFIVLLTNFVVLGLEIVQRLFDEVQFIDLCIDCKKIIRRFETRNVELDKLLPSKSSR